MQSYILSQPDILIEFTKQTDCIADNKNWITKNFLLQKEGHPLRKQMPELLVVHSAVVIWDK